MSKKANPQAEAPAAEQAPPKAAPFWRVRSNLRWGVTSPQGGVSTHSWRAGQLITLPEDQAGPLQARGLIEAAPEPTPEPAQEQTA